MESLGLTPSIREVYQREQQLSQEAGLKRVLQVVFTVYNNTEQAVPLRTRVLSTTQELTQFLESVGSSTVLGEEQTLEGFHMKDREMRSVSGTLIACAIYPVLVHERVDAGLVTAPWLCTREIIASSQTEFTAAVFEGNCALHRMESALNTAELLYRAFRSLGDVMARSVDDELPGDIIGVRARYMVKAGKRVVDVFETDAAPQQNHELMAFLEGQTGLTFDKWALTPDGNKEFNLHEKRGSNWQRAENEKKGGGRGRH